jgi:hypothetical protein
MRNLFLFALVAILFSSCNIQEQEPLKFEDTKPLMQFGIDTSIDLLRTDGVNVAISYDTAFTFVSFLEEPIYMEHELDTVLIKAIYSYQWLGKTLYFETNPQSNRMYLIF